MSPTTSIGLFYAASASRKRAEIPARLVNLPLQFQRTKAMEEKDLSVK